MAEIISLSKARKHKAKSEKEKTAGENRIKFARTKTEKKLSKSKKIKQNKHLSDHKIDY